MEVIRIDKTEGDLVFDLFYKYRVFYKKEYDIEKVKKFIQTKLDNNESVIFVALAKSTKNQLDLHNYIHYYHWSKQLKIGH